MGVAVFIVGGAIIELFYLKKYKSTYMMLRLIGFDHKEKNKILIIHTIYQMLMILCMAMVIYLTASLPALLVDFHIMKYEDVMRYVNEIYNYYMVYCYFSMMHFVILTILIFIVIGLLHLLMKKYYEKQDLVSWLKEG